ncbi:DUF2141 domain-containing protein [Sphingomonas sp. M1A8_2b]
MNDTGTNMANISEPAIGAAPPTSGVASALATPSAHPTARRLCGAAGIGAVWMMLAATAPVTRLDVEVDNLRSSKGTIRICLTADPKNFPACVDDADALTRSIPASVRTTSFPGLPQRAYALAIIHDENNNAKLDTIAGIPREGYGFSRNAAVRFGPPRFSAAQFTLAGDADMQQVKMRYIF